MEQEERDFRFKMQHIGDYFVETVEHFWDGLKGSFRGVNLTVEIHSLKQHRNRIVCDLGERVIEIRRTDPTINVAVDEEALGLFSELDKVQAKLETGIMERESRVNRWRFEDACAE